MLCVHVHVYGRHKGTNEPIDRPTGRPAGWTEFQIPSRWAATFLSANLIIVFFVVVGRCWHCHYSLYCGSSLAHLYLYFTLFLLAENADRIYFVSVVIIRHIIIFYISFQFTRTVCISTIVMNAEHMFDCCSKITEFFVVIDDRSVVNKPHFFHYSHCLLVWFVLWLICVVANCACVESTVDLCSATASQLFRCVNHSVHRNDELPLNENMGFSLAKLRVHVLFYTRTFIEIWADEVKT